MSFFIVSFCSSIYRLLKKLKSMKSSKQRVGSERSANENNPYYFVVQRKSSNTFDESRESTQIEHNDENDEFLYADILDLQPHTAATGDNVKSVSHDEIASTTTSLVNDLNGYAEIKDTTHFDIHLLNDHETSHGDSDKEVWEENMIYESCNKDF